MYKAYICSKFKFDFKKSNTIKLLLQWNYRIYVAINHDLGVGKQNVIHYITNNITIFFILVLLYWNV